MYRPLTMKPFLDGAAQVRYEQSLLGVLSPGRGAAQVFFLKPEHDALIERGDAAPAGSTPDSTGVSHNLHGPPDVTAVLELFDRRYRDVRGEDITYRSEESACPDARDARGAPKPARFLDGSWTSVRCGSQAAVVALVLT